jgi:hypothetical protein
MKLIINLFPNELVAPYFFAHHWVTTWCTRPKWISQTLFFQAMKSNRSLHDNCIQFLWFGLKYVW